MGTLTKGYASRFSKQTRAKGAAYYAGGRVELDASSDPVFTATVDGSETYSVSVNLDGFDLDEDWLDADCSCPHFADGFDCKHIWATLLAIDDYLIESDEFSVSLAIGPTGRTPSRRDKSKRGKSAAGSRSKKSSSRAKTDTTPEWQRTLDQISGQIPRYAPQFTPSTPPVRVWFVIDVPLSNYNKKLVINCRQQQLRRNGEWGAVKSFKLTQSSLKSLPGDLEDLVAQLASLHARYDYHNYNYGYYYQGYDSFSDTVSLDSHGQQLILPQLAQSGRLLWELGNGQRLDLSEPIVWDDGPAWSLQLQLTSAGESEASKTAQPAPGDLLLQGRIVRDNQSRPLDDIVHPLDGFVLFQDRLCRADGSIVSAWGTTLRQRGPLRIPAGDVPSFLQKFYSMADRPSLGVPEELGIEVDRQVDVTPVLRLAHANDDSCTRNSLQAEVHFSYDGRTIPAESKARDVFVPESQRLIVRDLAAESAALEDLKHSPLIPAIRRGCYLLSERNLLELTESFGAKGWKVEIEGKRVRSAGAFEWNVTSGIDWFDLDASVEFDGMTLKLPELLKSLDHQQRYVTLSDGSQGVLPEELLHRIQSLTDFAGAGDKSHPLRFRRTQAALLDALLSEHKHLKVDAAFEGWRKELKSLAGVPPKQPPRGFQGELRPYQQEGLGWLSFLQQFGFGGCLADDMGLGKTVQVLALLDSRRKRKITPDDPRRPSLVVVPKSLIFNWIEEAGRFTPRLKFCNYTSSERHELRDRFDEFDVVVTTYGTLRKDVRQLKDIQFDYAILDEAQAVKNSSSLAAKACRLIQARHRLAMTGTPVENHLGELWSLFDFLNPGLLGRSQRFQSLTRKVKENGNALTAISRAVAPFLLRRTKQQVLKDLPDKTEQTIHCSLSAEERRYYNELRDHYRALLTDKIREQGGLKQAKIHVLEALLRLRQAACHPGLIDKSKTGAESAKVEALLEQVKEVIDEGHKALVFSQFTSLLRIVRNRLDADGVAYQYLDGKTRDRKAQVDQFQTDPDSRLFLISLKAGGQGLNLTAADYVFILDPWWNPAVEAQAIDRAHRIGQTRPVFAYRFIARNTVEEKVLELQRSKKELADAIVTANDSLIRTLTAEDLQLLLS